ncbi:multiple sugar transport system permease protein [Microbacterium testaceum]|uniref:Carbohydrate ABC transporter permease n=1 Tax=Microbacterium algihabitans TaxID=3075992 RepID=A0ABU3RWL3_9MICO|nr:MULTISPECIES: carbohydrate ABC transporter permease [Microbacterium]MCD2170545.1 carbohydrate ABC transporter permease [Microbacterium sp. JC 701]MDQ1175105.1 multiple sugar transport system permease protein [Microbacterium testaceum]MDU0327273.1 carbohydrate ABC transporter permease [Microbacterium sp. KSW2-21]
MTATLPSAPAVVAPASAPPVARRRRRRGWMWTLVTIAVLVVYLFPVYWMVSASLQPSANSADTQWFPTAPGLGGYEKALDDAGIGGLRVTTLVSLGSVLVTLLVSIPAAYALSRLRSRAVSIALILLLLAQMIPSVVLATSFYAMFNSWGLLNTFIGLILANSTAGVPFAVIVMRAFMLRLDTEVLEAATVDGLGPFGTLWRIVVPLSRNAIVTAGVFAFLFSWGDLLFGLTLVNRNEMYPMSVLILALSNSNLNTWAATMAASLIASLPALVVILAAQRHVKAGLTAGAGR